MGKIMVTGIALHYFDAEPGKKGDAKHDKFYRLYLRKYPLANGVQYEVTRNWGRDTPGAEGQIKTQVFYDEKSARKYMQKLADSKLKEGYEYLGEAEVELVIGSRWATGETLLNATGRRPTKIPGVSVLIMEEEDIFDLIE